MQRCGKKAEFRFALLLLRAVDQMGVKKRIQWAHCNTCNGSKRHAVLYEKHFRFDDEVNNGYELTSWDTYYLLQCLGCETVHLKHESSFSEDIEPDGRPIVHTKIYPPRTSRAKPA